ncbi:MAG: hypothetical protein AB7O67_10390 [Vicinamibacterales bacterium]
MRTRRTTAWLVAMAVTAAAGLALAFLLDVSGGAAPLAPGPAAPRATSTHTNGMHTTGTGHSFAATALAAVPDTVWLLATGLALLGLAAEVRRRGRRARRHWRGQARVVEARSGTERLSP